MVVLDRIIYHRLSEKGMGVMILDEGCSLRLLYIFLKQELVPQMLRLGQKVLYML